MDPRLLPLVKAFLAESQDLTQRLTRAVLTLELNSAAPGELEHAWSELRRGLHTLKGSAATVGLHEHSALGHALEDRVGRERRPLVRADVDLLLAAFDAFLDGLRRLAAAEAEPLERLRAFMASLGVHAAPTGDEPPVLPPPASAPEAHSSAPEAHPGAPTAAPAPLEGPGGYRISAADLSLWQANVERLRDLRLRLEERHQALTAHLETLARLRLPALASLRLALDGEAALLGADADGLGEALESLEGSLKAVATTPVHELFAPLHRVVRDLARQLGKEAVLRVAGEEVAVERRLVEALRGPLAHLVRNAVDHGVEAPAVRERAGKHAVGAISARVELVGNLLFLELADDGAGVDLPRLREVAVRQGLGTAAALAAMDTPGLLGLLSRPGFTTRQEVSSTSGRGVGLDAVAQDLKRLGGTMEVHSVTGQGTRFTLTVPTSLGSTPLLLLRCGAQTLALPTISVEVAQRAAGDALQKAGEGQVLVHGGRPVPVRELGPCLGLPTPRRVEGGALLVLQLDARRVALRVDEVLGDRELSLLPMPAELAGLAAYQGVAALAGGELVPVLRPAWLFEEARAVRVEAAGRRRALVVDDSLTARALHRTVLEAGGYEVHAVGDGEAALAQVRTTPYDALVFDVGMVPMDGLALTRAVRAEAGLGRVPILLVSGRDEEQVAWAEAGANAFLAKRDCAAGRLLQELTRLVAAAGGPA